MRSCWPCPAPTTPCSGSSTLRMKNYAPPGISTGRSARTDSMANPSLVQPAQRKKIRLSVLPNAGPGHDPPTAHG
jgi:hypothetical protein